LNEEGHAVTSVNRAIYAAMQPSFHRLDTYYEPPVTWKTIEARKSLLSAGGFISTIVLREFVGNA
jgi:hypothetical protein